VNFIQICVTWFLQPWRGLIIEYALKYDTNTRQLIRRGFRDGSEYYTILIHTIVWTIAEMVDFVKKPYKLLWGSLTLLLLILLHPVFLLIYFTALLHTCFRLCQYSIDPDIEELRFVEWVEDTPRPTLQSPGTILSQSGHLVRVYLLRLPQACAFHTIVFFSWLWVEFVGEPSEASWLEILVLFSLVPLLTLVGGLLSTPFVFLWRAYYWNRWASFTTVLTVYMRDGWFRRNRNCLYWDIHNSVGRVLFDLKCEVKQGTRYYVFKTADSNWNFK
jgi:hypothetical protein